MPQGLLNEWNTELQHDSITDVDLRKRIEIHLDSGYGSCSLRDRRIADKVRETPLKWDGVRYKLIAWVVMGNHVHILIELLGDHSLSAVMHSIKSFTAHEANKILGRLGRYWAVESYDRHIRNKDHLRNTIHYIERNPVKAGLCRAASDWEFSSAFGKKQD